MSDQQIVEYLRSRGQANPPPDLVGSVMAAVDAAPEPRSGLAALLPAAVAAGALAVIATLALFLGAGGDIGGPSSTTPTPTPTPAGRTTAPTLGELEAAVTAAIERLAAAPAVEGRQTSTVEGYLASATWFDWRPSGEEVAVTRTDIDVSAPWWTDPDGDPLSVGERIDTSIWVIVDRTAYASRDDGWLVLEPSDAPTVLHWASGMLSGEIPPLGPIDTDAEPVITHATLADGGELWRMEIAGDDGPGSIEWDIGADGVLRSYRVAGPYATFHPMVDLGSASAETVIEFTPIDGPAPLLAPDREAVPDAEAVGAPPDMPLEPPPPSLDDVEQVETCEHPSGRYRVTLPDGWWTNRNGGDAGALWDACELFGPEPFAVTPAADRPLPDGVALSIGWIDGGCIGSFLELLSSDETTVSGLPASVREYAWGTNPDDPPGLYEYVIDLSEPGVDCEVGGRFVMAGTSLEMAGDYEENKAFLDQVMESMEITQP